MYKVGSLYNTPKANKRGVSRKDFEQTSTRKLCACVPAVHVVTFFHAKVCSARLRNAKNQVFTSQFLMNQATAANMALTKHGTNPIYYASSFVILIQCTIEQFSGKIFDEISATAKTGSRHFYAYPHDVTFVTHNEAIKTWARDIAIQNKCHCHVYSNNSRSLAF
jgi:hypothetical protein